MEILRNLFVLALLRVRAIPTYRVVDSMMLFCSV